MTLPEKSANSEMAEPGTDISIDFIRINGNSIERSEENDYCSGNSGDTPVCLVPVPYG